jgi:histidine triad (HIT) family protein
MKCSANAGLFVWRYTEHMQDSIFTKIIKGEIPCHKVYEDDKTLAFLDIDPLLPGHVLVVPKNQIDHVDDLPDDDYVALFATVKKVAKRVKEVMQSERAVIVVMGYDVPHAHVHVLPCDKSRDFYEVMAQNLERSETTEPDHAALAAMAARLAF